VIVSLGAQRARATRCEGPTAAPAVGTRPLHDLSRRGCASAALAAQLHRHREQAAGACSAESRAHRLHNGRREGPGTGHYAPAGRDATGSRANMCCDGPGRGAKGGRVVPCPTACGEPRHRVSLHPSTPHLCI